MRLIIPALVIPLLVLSGQRFFEKKDGFRGPERKEWQLPAAQKSNTDSATWIAGFTQFREAVFRKERAKVKAFFRFPVMNEGNEIWYVAYGNDDKKISRLPSKTKPFTAADFDKYYDNLISKSFTTALLKIKSGELFKKGTTETIEFKEDKNTTYKMYATVDEDGKVLSLNLAFNTIEKDENGEVLDGGESNIIYQFRITGNKIIFKQIRIAG